MEVVRSFIAIELPEELKAELLRLQSKLREDSPGGVRWVAPNGIHLTLKFLGDVAADRLDEVILAMEEAAIGISPFRLEVKELGAFPNLSRVRVVWVGITGDTHRLADLARRIEFNVAQLGFPAEERSFKAHLTLARVGNRVWQDKRQRLGKLIAGVKFEASRGIEVDSINLMKSELTSEGAVYTRIGSVKLG
jgi:2'-5' RNA ligase